jgi:thiol-disulfide isomerase/thioredoxin
MKTGIMGLLAPPLERVRWIDDHGNERPALTMSELGDDFKILFFFQDWCESCHRHGFPTFAALAKELSGKGIGLAAIQTVFEAPEVNTFDRLRENQRRYGLCVPFGHAIADSASAHGLPEIMTAYRAAGTPWFVVIAPDGSVVYDGFLVAADGLIQALRPLAS